jgi:hypothetical protein
MKDKLGNVIPRILFCVLVHPSTPELLGELAVEMGLESATQVIEWLTTEVFVHGADTVANRIRH